MAGQRLLKGVFDRSRAHSKLEEIEWPHKKLNLTKVLSTREQSEIAGRLLAYLMFPPPVLPRAGGLAQKAGSKEKILKIKRKATNEKLKTFFAVQIATRLSLQEKKYEHNYVPAPRYDFLFREFRLLAGFSRLFSEDGPRLVDQKISTDQWHHMLGAFAVFDLFYRLSVSADGHTKRVCTETTALHIVLLMQAQLGLRVSHSTLSKACRTYRSVAHILVGVLSAVRGQSGVEEWLRAEARTPSPALTTLRKRIHKVLVPALRRSVEIGKAFREIRIKGRGDGIVSAAQQVSLPPGLVLGAGVEKVQGLTVLEQKLASGFATLQRCKPAVRKQAKAKLAIPQSITSNSSEVARKTFLNRINELSE